MATLSIELAVNVQGDVVFERVGKAESGDPYTSASCVQSFIYEGSFS
jgi:hypothetical protein